MAAPRTRTSRAGRRLATGQLTEELTRRYRKESGAPLGRPGAIVVVQRFGSRKPVKRDWVKLCFQRANSHSELGEHAQWCGFSMTQVRPRSMLGVDAVLFGADGATFVDWLRRAMSCGGFAGWHGGPMPVEVRALTEGFVGF